MKKITVSILSVLMMLSMVFSTSVFAAEKTNPVADFFAGIFGAQTSDVSDVGVEYRGHVENKGDFPVDGTWIQGPERLGTVGEGLRLEAFWIKLADTAPAGLHIKYQVHVQNKGWMGFVEDGALAGTEGEALRIEAIQISLVDDEGNIADGYSVEYRGHVQNIGDTEWYADGAQLGTTGSGLRLEALEIKIVQLKADMTAYNAAVAAAAALTETDYTAESWAALQTALTDNVVTEDNTQAEVDAATAAINAAIDALVEVTHVTGVEAINATQATVTFSGAVKAVVPANFSVKDANGNTAFVSGVTLNAAKTEATLTFFNKFVNDGVYTVTTSNVVDAENLTIATSVESFTYIAADAASVVFTGTTILPGGDIKTLLTVTDTLGRDITKEVALEYETSNVTVINGSGTAVGASGTSAIVVAKVAVGTTYVKSAQTTINVSDAAEKTFVGYNVYVAPNTVTTTTAFNALAADKKVDFVYKSDAASKLALYYNDQFGESMTAVDATNFVARGAVVTNLTPTIVIVENNGSITPISVGDGFVKVKVGTVEQTVKITVKADPIVTTMELDKTNVSVVAGQTADVKVTFKNQYGTVVTGLTPVAVSKAPATATATAGADKVTIGGVAKGTTTADVTYVVGTTTLKQTINITVVEPGTLANYTPVAAFTSIDANAATASLTVPHASGVTVNEIDTNGNIIGTVLPANTTLTEVDAAGVAVVTGNLVSINDATDTVTAVKAGTAYVQVKVGSLVVGTLQFTVVNTGTVATAAEFNSLAVVYTNVDAAATGIDTSLEADLEALITVKDQNGVVIAPTPALVVTYTTTNRVGISDTLATLTAESATATVVVTSVTAGGDNLIAAPVQLELSATADTATATAAVVTYEGSTYTTDALIKTAIDNKVAAQAAVTALPAGTTKTALQARIDAEDVNLDAAATIATVTVADGTITADGTSAESETMTAVIKNAANVTLTTALTGDYAASYAWSVTGVTQIGTPVNSLAIGDLTITSAIVNPATFNKAITKTVDAGASYQVQVTVDQGALITAIDVAADIATI
ncbi:hypothetical protein [Acetobacterium sp. K1/6]|uniref:hypothetical protein n=1 Tax=Acetobacterium sp. K1/6 TaxID=3055467 RepID=UPI002ACA8514|nr:hypothetical protein [Acetobacterium sp. K1/6]MDZ5725241.1 hypothetical protein [Acetobacterium sp. K1/6]